MIISNKSYCKKLWQLKVLKRKNNHNNKTIVGIKIINNLLHFILIGKVILPWFLTKKWHRSFSVKVPSRTEYWFIYSLHFINSNLPHYRWFATSSVIYHITCNLLHCLEFSAFTKFSFFTYVLKCLGPKVICYITVDLLHHL